MAMVRGGKRANVTVHTRLAMQPSGCIIWVICDPDRFEPVSYRWFGSAPGLPMPYPGSRVARHAKGNAAGVKLTRPMHRVIPAGWFETVADVAGPMVVMYVRCPLSLRNVENLLFERGIDICHESVRLWWNRFGPMITRDRSMRANVSKAITSWYGARQVENGLALG